MSLFAFVLRGLLSLPLAYDDRAPELVEDKTVQLLDVAVAVTEAVEAEQRWPGSRQELAAMAIATAWSESKLALRIHRGQCLALECDRGRARGLWQIQRQRWMTLDDWDRLHGLENTRHAARIAVRMLTRARNLCRSLEGSREWVEMTFASYGTGRGCAGTLRDMRERVATYRRVMGVRAGA